MTLKDIQNFYDFNDDKNEYNSSDNDDQHEIEGLTAVILSLLNINKNIMNEDTVSRGDILSSTLYISNSMREDPQIDSRGPTAKKVSPFTFNQNIDIIKNLITFFIVINELISAIITISAFISQSLSITRRLIESTTIFNRPQRARKVVNNVNF